MKYRQKFFLGLSVVSLVVIAAFFSSCEGGTCAATDSPLTDADSDCVEDGGGDNCPLIYNPDQFDGDEDGIGFDCDTDDTDEAVALITDTRQVAASVQYVTAENTALFSSPVDSCVYSVVGCNDFNLGSLDADNSLLNDLLANPLSAFASDFATCSAFNPNASYPPAVYCDSGTDNTHLVGFLTLNPEIDGALPTCDFLHSLDIQTDLCASL